MNAELPERVRLFVALELPEEVRAALVHWRAAALERVRALRPIVPEALHVTLCFLGARPAGEIGEIARACSGALAGAPLAEELRLDAGLWLPPRAPRVLAVGIADEAGAVRAVQASLSDALSAGGWYTPEKRPYLAHVTVARVRARERARTVELPPVPPLGFGAEAVTLYRSRLERSGARYEALARVGLHRGAPTSS